MAAPVITAWIKEAQVGNIATDYAVATDPGFLNFPIGYVDVFYGVHFYPNFVLDPPPPTITWTISAGSLPTGLSLDSATGDIVGNPTAAGFYSFTVTLTNSGGTSSYTFGVEITATYVTGIGGPIFVGLRALDQNCGNLYVAPVGAAETADNNLDIVVVIGEPPFGWKVSSGSLPPNVSISNLASGIGNPFNSANYIPDKFTGGGFIGFGSPLNGSPAGYYPNPTTPGTYTFTLRATNRYGYAELEVTIGVGSGSIAFTGLAPVFVGSNVTAHRSTESNQTFFTPASESYGGAGLLMPSSDFFFTSSSAANAVVLFVSPVPVWLPYHTINLFNPTNPGAGVYTQTLEITAGPGGAWGSDTDTFTVIVADEATPSCSLTVSPTTIFFQTVGDYVIPLTEVTLTWSTTGGVQRAYLYTFDEFIPGLGGISVMIGSVNPSGGSMVIHPSYTTYYLLHIMQDDAQGNCQVIVRVYCPPRGLFPHYIKRTGSHGH